MLLLLLLRSAGVVLFQTTSANHVVYVASRWPLCLCLLLSVVYCLFNMFKLCLLFMSSLWAIPSLPPGSQQPQVPRAAAGGAAVG